MRVINRPSNYRLKPEQLELVQEHLPFCGNAFRIHVEAGLQLYYTYYKLKVTYLNDVCPL